MLTAGIAFTSYNDVFRRRHKLYLSILKQFGYGQQKEMERRIHAGVSEFLRQVSLQGGEAFDPKEVLQLSVCSVIANLLMGRKFDYDDPTLSEFRDGVHEWVTSVVPELDVCPLLRFVPPVRRRMLHFADVHQKLLSFFQRQVVYTAGVCPPL